MKRRLRVDGAATCALHGPAWTTRSITFPRSCRPNSDTSPATRRWWDQAQWGVQLGQLYWCASSHALSLIAADGTARSPAPGTRQRDLSGLGADATGGKHDFALLWPLSSCILRCSMKTHVALAVSRRRLTAGAGSRWRLSRPRSTWCSPRACAWGTSSACAPSCWRRSPRFTSWRSSSYLRRPGSSTSAAVSGRLCCSET